MLAVITIFLFWATRQCYFLKESIAMSKGSNFFDDKQLTEKKQKQILLKQLSDQIKQAEEQVRDYSVFLCSVSPDQTMVELESLRGNLRWGTQEYAAVCNLSSSIRRSLDRCTSLDYRVRWEQIANVADDVSAAASGRRAESNLEIVRVRGSASPPQSNHQNALYHELVEKRASPSSRPHRSFTPTSVTVAPTTTVEVLVESLARTSPSRGTTAQMQASTRRLPLLSPQKEVLDNNERRGYEETASRAEDYFRSVEATPLNAGAALDVPRSHSRSWLLPPPQMSADRDDVEQPSVFATTQEPLYVAQQQTYSGPGMQSSTTAAVANNTDFFDASPRRESSGRVVPSEPRDQCAASADIELRRDIVHPPAAAPLTSHALAQREIRVLEQHYEAKLDEAHAHWRFERGDLVSKMEQMERLMREQHSLEIAELHESWSKERVSLLRDQNELRDELRESKEGTRDLEDQMDKLKQIVFALQSRLETSEDRSIALQEQHRALHDNLSRAVAAAPTGLIARQPSRSPTRVVETAVGTTTFTAPSTDALRSMGLIGVGDVSGFTSVIRSPTSDRDRFRRAGSLSSYETVSPGRTSPQSAL
jgi:hypothetical protein